MDGKDRFNFRSRVSFHFVPGFSVSRFTTTHAERSELVSIEQAKVLQLVTENGKVA